MSAPLILFGLGKEDKGLVLYDIIYLITYFDCQIIRAKELVYFSSL